MDPLLTPHSDQSCVRFALRSIATKDSPYAARVCHGHVGVETRTCNRLDRRDTADTGSRAERRGEFLVGHFEAEFVRHGGDASA